MSAMIFVRTIAAIAIGAVLWLSVGIDAHGGQAVHPAVHQIERHAEMHEITHDGTAEADCCAEAVEPGASCGTLFAITQCRNGLSLGGEISGSLTAVGVPLASGRETNELLDPPRTV